jgi:hypothetical protein
MIFPSRRQWKLRFLIFYEACLVDLQWSPTIRGRLFSAAPTIPSSAQCNVRNFLALPQGGQNT